MVLNAFWKRAFHLVNLNYDMYNTVVSVMKYGNIAPRAGIERVCLAFLASGLTITAHNFPDPATLPILTAVITCLHSYFPERSLQTTTLVPVACLLRDTFIYIYVYIYAV